MLSLSGFDNLALIYKGHHHAIYSALRAKDQKKVILKTFVSADPQKDEIALMYHELNVTKDLDLPGVIKTYDLVEEHNRYVLVQEDFMGVSLAEYIENQPIDDLTVFYKIAFQMVSVMGEIHKNQIIHKDIKPSNFIIQSDTLTLKLSDFQFSSKLPHEEQGLVPTSNLEGTLAYMAPEQTGRMNMNIDYRSDFYALGVTFFELLTRTLPFTSTDPLELVHAHLALHPPDAAEINVKVPKPLVKIIQKLMAKDPSDRYQSFVGIQKDLERCANGELEIFPLGEYDVNDRLNLSQKLYGREVEIQTLLQVYDLVSQGAVKTLMVNGRSGIGKTSLINEVHKPMTKHKGYFIQGKCDQLERNVPYKVLTETFNKLAILIMSEPIERFNAIKSSLEEALGNVGQVIIDLAPNMEQVLGKQRPLEKLPPQESQNRIMIFFKRFLHAIANEDHPLVIFIDDLQWVDGASLKLLEYILTDTDLTHLLLMGAYRDNEVDNQHPLMHLFKDKTIDYLPLKPLNLVHYEAFLKDSLHVDNVISFAELLYKRTEGNPFFCRQLIKTLHQKKLLCFDYNQSQWAWKLDKIEKLAITDNVIDLMLGKLKELPEETQVLLQIASCIGNEFNIATLMVICDQSAEVIGKTLWPAMQRELVLTTNLSYKRMDAISQKNLTHLLSNEIIYQFIHDRVQQAVYQSISYDEKQCAHLKIAKLLFEKELEACKKERLFEVTDHFNQAHKILEESEKIQVIHLNYDAAIKAMNSNAYEAMNKYLSSALSLMEENFWDIDYELAFKVNRELALSLFFLNEFANAEKLMLELLKRAKSSIDKVSIYRMLIKNYSVRENAKEAVNSAIIALDLLGVKFIPQPSKVDLFILFLKIQWEMRRFHLEKLNQELPFLNNINIESAFEILLELVFLTAYFGRTWISYLGLMGMFLLLKYGKPSSAGFWVFEYGVVVPAYFGSQNLKRANFYFTLAEKFYDQIPNSYSSSYLYGGSAFTLTPYVYPLKRTQSYYQKASQFALESGNISYKTMLYMSTNEYACAEAKSLNNIIVNIKSAIKAFKMMGIESMFRECVFLLNIFESFATDKKDNEEIIEKLYTKAKPDLFIITMVHTDKWISIYYFFFDFIDRAIEHGEHWYPLRSHIKFHTFTFQSTMIYGLALAKKMPQVSGLTKWRYKRTIGKITQDLEWISQECPSTYYHLFLFLKAMQCSFKGEYLKAVQMFDEGIANAKKGDFYLWVALGNELAGECSMEQKQTRAASAYLREAHYYYKLFGMIVKVHELERKYSDFFTKDGAYAEERLGSGRIQSSTLDLISTIKASQSISEEVDIKKLFHKILHFSIENAGAQKAVFLELINNEWQVSAEINILREGEQFRILQIPRKKFEELPQTIINVSLRSQESLIVNNPIEEPRFANDPYIQRVVPKSILCLPVIHQGKNMGLIYLENNLIAGAFKEERMTVLRLLSAQMAVSLENARHLQHTEFLYHSAERFVPKRYLKLLNKEHLEDVQLGDSIKRKLTPLFADIRGFTTLAENLTTENTVLLLNTYLKYMIPIIRKNNGFVNQILGDGLMALFSTSPTDAVHAAVEMTQALTIFNGEVKSKGLPTIDIGIGINTGDVMVGTLGEKESMGASVIGDVVNSSARIEGLNKYYKTQLLISDEVYQQLAHPEKYLIRIVDKVYLKGKKRAMSVYEVMHLPANDIQNEKDYITLFSKAFANYEKGDIVEAKKGFEQCLSKKPTDYLTEMFLNRCIEFEKHGLPEDWNGSFTMLDK